MQLDFVRKYHNTFVIFKVYIYQHQEPNRWLCEY